MRNDPRAYQYWYRMEMMYNFERNRDEARGTGWGEFCNNCEMLRLCRRWDMFRNRRHTLMYSPFRLNNKTWWKDESFVNFSDYFVENPEENLDSGLWYKLPVVRQACAAVLVLSSPHPILARRNLEMRKNARRSGAQTTFCLLIRCDSCLVAVG